MRDDFKRYLLVVLRFVGDMLQQNALFILVVLGGTALFTLAAQLIGYESYSGRGSLSADEEFAFLLAFFRLFLPIAVIFPGIVFLIVRILERLRVRHRLVASVVAVGAACVGLVMTAAAAWVSAIPPMAVLVAAFLGALYGAFLLPKGRGMMCVRRVLVACCGPVNTNHGGGPIW